MTKTEALAIIASTGLTHVDVTTRGGIPYRVYADVIEAADDGEPYVYGERLDNAPSGPFRKAAPSTRWFLLKNVKVLEH